LNSGLPVNTRPVPVVDHTLPAESKGGVAGDAAAKALRHGVATKARTIAQGKLKELRAFPGKHGQK